MCIFSPLQTFCDYNYGTTYIIRTDITLIKMRGVQTVFAKYLIAVAGGKKLLKTPPSEVIRSPSLVLTRAGLTVSVLIEGQIGGLYA